jgi:beta-N-acetylhexosaminidase
MIGVARWWGSSTLHNRPGELNHALAVALGEGLKAGGMGPCGKHFPGHGYVIPDSHVELPVDERPLEAMTEDLLPFRQLPLDADHTGIRS